MLLWREIKSIEDKTVLRFLGKNLFAMNGVGYYSEDHTNEYYVLVVGNGVIIQIHNHPYVIALIKKKYPLSSLDKPKMEDILTHITIFSIVKVTGIPNENHYIDSYKKLIENEFLISEYKLK